MNRVFKTKWSVAHQEYVVTDEKHASKTKAAKSVVALAVAALMLGAGAASAAYMEKGQVATSNADLEAAKQSWQSDEYKKDWGLEAMKASSAYALGYHGQGVKVAVMDSGALLQKHPELAGDRFSGTHVQGEYGSTGNRYPQSVVNGGKGQPYEKGEAFDVTGDWMMGVNDSHGTHVTGTVGGNRDGNEFHGVSWGSDIVVGNTGATDSNNYGPFQDHDYFYAGWKALADDLIASNGADRGGVINNSWGTNARVMVLQVSYKDEKTGEIKWKTVKDEAGNMTYQHAGEGLGDRPTDPNKEGSYRWYPSGHLPANSVADSEYEFFYSNMMYGDKFAAGEANSDKSFVDAAYEAVKGTNVVQIFTTGNRNMENPFYRPLYPYFNPEAEKHWIAVAGLQIDYDEYKDENGKWQIKYNYGTDGKYKYKWVDGFNEAGLAKWWTVVAPGDMIYSSTVDDKTGEAGYDSWGGTSMAAPHVAGAMGVLMSRYQDMSALQVRDVMFTTANRYNTDKTLFEGWTSDEGVPDDNYGWGVPDLDKGMYGPGQFLGKFNYNMQTSALDVWTNDISQKALDARKAEDEKWLEDYAKNLNADFNLGEDFVIGDGTEASDDHVISLEDAKKWRKEYFEKRKAAIEAKLKNGEYDGTLVKSGTGTLVMTGSNTYRGGTTVEGGTLLGFAESFGVSGTATKATGNGQVTVKDGGTFGLLETFNDTFTMQGEKTATNDHTVDVSVEKGGKFLVTAGQDVTMGGLTLADGAVLTVGSNDVDALKDVYNGTDATGSVTVGSVTGDKYVVEQADYAFFTGDVKVDGNTLTGTLSRDETKSFATYAQNANGQAIAGALEGAAGGALYDALIGASKGDVAKTYNSLGDDFILNTRNAGIVNGMTLSRAIKDQAAGIGEGRKVEMADGTARLWATGVGSWSALDYGQSDMDSDFYAGLFGAEVDVCSATKLGLFFGAGSTDNKAGDNKVESDDIHFGAYGVTNFSDVVNATYGFVYSHQSADATRALQVGSQLGMNAFSGDTDITQIFAEAAYTGLNTSAYSIEPYFGLSWIHAESDGFNEQIGTMAFSTTTEDQDVQVTTLGVRSAIPFTMGETKVALKGDVAWNHFFGDTEAEASMNLAGSGVARLKGGELGDMASVGLGVEAQVGKMTTMGLSYTGAYDGDITSHGISANVRFNF